MIYSLRRKFIIICTVSFMAVLAAMIAVIFVSNAIKQNKMLDMMCDIISESGGMFPKHNTPEFDRIENSQPMPHFIDKETPFSTRYFVVFFDDAGKVKDIDISFISSISEDTARQNAEKVISKKDRGWYDEYRYRIYETDGERMAVFVNGSMFRSTNMSYMMSTGRAFAIGGAVVMLLIVVISGIAVKPAAESYEKQKQFVTDANHELKTPLTLILTNIEIAEAELGQNEWLDDIRSEGEQMSRLVNKLVTLSRMDENSTLSDPCRFDLSNAVLDVYSEFEELVRVSGLKISSDIEENISLNGSEQEIRQLVAILLDNAVKYCDGSGEITVALKRKRHIHLTVTNTCSEVDNIQLDKLFDRFYRSDKARTSGSGFGIGLSIAQSVVHRHRGEINAVKVDNDKISFKIQL